MDPWIQILSPIWTVRNEAAGCDGDEEDDDDEEPRDDVHLHTSSPTWSDHDKGRAFIWSEFGEVTQVNI